MKYPEYYRINQYSNSSSLTILGNMKAFVSFEECLKKMIETKKSNPKRDVSVEYFY